MPRWTGRNCSRIRRADMFAPTFTWYDLPADAGVLELAQVSAGDGPGAGRRLTRCGRHLKLLRDATAGA